MATFLSLAVIEKLSYPQELKSPNEYEQYLHTYCSNQKKIIAEHKKAIKNDSNTNKLLNKILNSKKLDKSKNESNDIIENITEKNNKENIQISGHKQVGLIFWEGFIEALKNKTQPTIEQMIDFLVNLAKRKISNSEEAQ